MKIIRCSVIVLLFAVAMLFLPLNVYASTYYVDYATGSDYASGNSTGAAWKHSPGDNNATAIAASTTLTAGDTIYFKGGVTYRGCIVLSRSGTEGNNITYDGNSAGTWGTGKAVIIPDNTYNAAFYAKKTDITRIMISNFEITGITYSGIKFEARSSYITISNCYMHELGYWNNDGSKRPSGRGIFAIGPTSWYLTGNEITKVGGTGIGLPGAVNCLVESNHIHDYITWGIDIAGDYALPTGNIIRGNTIHDLYHYDLGFWGGSDEPPHTDFIFIRQGGGSRPNGNIIEQNFFYNNYNFTDSGGTAMIFMDHADNTIIRNNVLINPHSYFAISADWGSADTKIYNNTIYAPQKTPIRVITTGVDTRIYNNIAIGSKHFIDMANETTLDSISGSNNNLFIRNGSNYFVAHMTTPNANYTLPAWNGLGKDINSITVTSVGDIQFVRVSGYPTACQTMNLQLSSSSPAVNRGLTINGITNDKNGKSRPLGSFIDIGAYEFDERIPRSILNPRIN